MRQVRLKDTLDKSKLVNIIASQELGLFARSITMIAIFYQWQTATNVNRYILQCTDEQDGHGGDLNAPFMGQLRETCRSLITPRPLVLARHLAEWTTAISESIQSISINTEAWPESESSQLLKLYHHISILLVVPVTPMCDYIGWMGSEGSISQTRVGLCQWIRTDIENARRTVIHAASLFCLIRKRKSGAHSENHHIFVAFLVLWVFFSLDPIARPRGVANDGSSDIPSCTIDWDGRVNSDAQAKWIRSPGHPPLRIAGVGDLTESTGLQRILVETHRILCSDQMWGISRLFASVLESLLSHGDAIDVDGVK